MVCLLLLELLAVMSMNTLPMELLGRHQTWTARTAGNFYAATTSGAGYLVGISTFGWTAPTAAGIGTSTDGITWTARTMPSAGYYASWEHAIAYGR
jgi:hypothetical protein